MVESAVGAWALEHGLPVQRPESLKDPEVLDTLRGAHPDVMVVAAYGLILPAAVLAIPPGGCLNIHASLLPRWRGAAPVQRALLAGDTRTGVSIMRMDEGLDTGPVLMEKSVAIEARETAATLTEKLAGLGAASIVEALAMLGRLPARPQADCGATYAAKIRKSEARIDWSASNVEIERQVRAFDPFPGAETSYKGTPLKIWEATLADGEGAPGTVLEASADGLVVACGKGAIRLLALQKSGGKRLRVAEFLPGARGITGAILGEPARMAPTEGGFS